MIHSSWVVDACSSRTSVGRATLTIVVSRLIANAARSSAVRLSGLLAIAGPPGSRLWLEDARRDLPLGQIPVSVEARVLPRELPPEGSFLLGVRATAPDDMVGAVGENLGSGAQRASGSNAAACWTSAASVSGKSPLISGPSSGPTVFAAGPLISMRYVTRLRSHRAD